MNQTKMPLNSSRIRALQLIQRQPNGRMTDEARAKHGIQLRTLEGLQEAGLTKFVKTDRPQTWKATAAGKLLPQVRDAC